MDKDNLDIHGILTSLADETLQTARAENFQQLISAFCLVTVGLFLTLIGLLGLLLKLSKLIACSILFVVRPITLLFLPEKINSKVAVESTAK